MTSYCKVNGCTKTADYDAKFAICSNHDTKNAKEVVEFSTWFSDNCATIITGNYKIWLAVYKKDIIHWKKNQDNEERLGSLFKESYWNDYTFSGAQEKAREIRKELSEDRFYANPMLVAYPSASEYINWWGLNVFVRKSYFRNVSDPDDYAETLDVLSIDRGLYSHFVIYLGKGRVCNYNRENGAFFDTWQSFLTGRGGSSLSSSYSSGGSNAIITRYHSTIPFKSPGRIVEHIAKVISAKMGKSGSGIHEYCLANRNCEHFVNSVVFGIDYSYQAEGSPSQVRNFCPSKSCCENRSVNNGKSRICIADEIRNTNEKLDSLESYCKSSDIEREKERINQYIYEAKIEVPTQNIIFQAISSSNWNTVKSGR